MFNLIISLLKYLLTGFIFLFVIFMSVFIEYLASYSKKIFNNKLNKRREIGDITLLKKQFFNKVVMPETASAVIVVWAPILALSALIPISTTIPLFSFIPYLQINTDLLQIVQFFLLSDVFAVLAICALGTKTSRQIAKEMTKEFAYLFFFIFLFFTVIAIYIDKTSKITDAFKLNSLALSGLISTENFLIYTVLIFISIIIFSLLPHEVSEHSNYLVNDDVLIEFQGAPRAMLSLWLLFRSFLLISIILIMIFPFTNIFSYSQNINIPWFLKVINFLVYFVAIIFMRIFVIPIFWTARNKLKQKLPRFLSCILFHLIIVLIICFVFVLNLQSNLFRA